MVSFPYVAYRGEVGPFQVHLEASYRVEVLSCQVESYLGEEVLAWEEGRPLVYPFPFREVVPLGVPPLLFLDPPDQLGPTLQLVQRQLTFP